MIRNGGERRPETKVLVKICGNGEKETQALHARCLRARRGGDGGGGRHGSIPHAARVRLLMSGHWPQSGRGNSLLISE